MKQFLAKMWDAGRFLVVYWSVFICFLLGSLLFAMRADYSEFDVWGIFGFVSEFAMCAVFLFVAWFMLGSGGRERDVFSMRRVSLRGVLLPLVVGVCFLHVYMFVFQMAYGAEDVAYGEEAHMPSLMSLWNTVLGILVYQVLFVTIIFKRLLGGMRPMQAMGCMLGLYLLSVGMEMLLMYWTSPEWLSNAYGFGEDASFWEVVFVFAMIYGVKLVALVMGACLFMWTGSIWASFALALGGV